MPAVLSRISSGKGLIFRLHETILGEVSNTVQLQIVVVATQIMGGHSHVASKKRKLNVPKTCLKLAKRAVFEKPGLVLQEQLTK